MKKKLLMISALVLVLTLAFSTSVALADKPPKTVGERVYLYSNEDGTPGELTFSENEPFHIQHGIMGWYEIGEPVGNYIGLENMTLEVDGVKQKPDYLVIDYDLIYKDYGWRIVYKTYIFNFPDGMTGEHTFVRRYFVVCESVADEYDPPLACKNSAELVEHTLWNQTLEVTFVE